MRAVFESNYLTLLRYLHVYVDVYRSETFYFASEPFKLPSFSAPFVYALDLICLT